MNPTARFSDRAATYAANRPGYGNDVFEALLHDLDAHALTVADIGAGTGISANALAAHVARVVAVEPNREMRSHALAHERVEWRGGTAEHTGLAHESVDVAVAFQAFHWFDADGAYSEFCRIARTRVAMVQYERDERDAFTAAFGALVRDFMTDDTELIRLRALERFAILGGDALRHRKISGTQMLDNVSLVGRIDSASYLPHSGDAADELRSRARALFAEFAHDGIVTLAMTTHVLYADLA